MKFYKKIVGDRIYLSPKSIDIDAIDIYTKWMNDFEVTDYIGRSAQIQPFLNEKEYLENSAKDTKDKHFDIVLLDNDHLIGSVSLIKIDYLNRNATLGIFIGDFEYRNNGYGREAIKLILEYAFKYLNLHSVNLTLLSINERAHKCYLKCGFKDTGYDREAMFLNGKYYDVLRMDIIENEFKEDVIRNKNIK